MARRSVMSGELFGPYRVVETLGRGGMGVVYRGEHTSTGRHVAIKTVLVTTEGLLHSIRREMHTLAHIHHPGIVRIVDEGATAGVPWYAMELVKGVSLIKYCLALRERHSSTHDESEPAMAGTRSRSPTSEAATIDPHGMQSRKTRLLLDPIPSGALRDTLTVVRRLCAALSFLHGEGIVHRDLKFDNVLVTAKGVPVLVDFGLATQFDGRLDLSTLQSSTLAEGTLSYIAPEVLDGRVADARADLYALGCILFALLAGRFPFTGAAFEVADGHLHRTPERLRDVAPHLPDRLSDLVERLLAKDPRERIGYADDVGATLATLGAKDLPANLPRPVSRPYLYRPGFAGRDALLNHLGAAAIRLSATGRLVLLGGESGVGKTRLLLEFVRACSDEGSRTQVFEGECPPSAGGPLEALRRPLQAIADRCRALGPDEAVRIVGDAARFFAVCVPEFGELPGVSSGPAIDVQGREARQRLWEALTRTFRALAERQPVVLVLDDLQWADELTLSWLEYLRDTSALDTIPLLIVGSYRTEECSGALERLITRPRVQSIVLGRLEPAEVSRIVGDMLALGTPPRLLSDHLARYSEGNPFFVAEYLRMAIGERLLARDDAGRWRLPEEDRSADPASFYESLPLPDSLNALVSRRLDHLGNEAVAALAAASVLGRESETDVLARVAEIDRNAALGAVAELLRRQILDEPEPGRLRFVHDKIREVAYARLPESRRRELHGSAAGILENAAVRRVSADPREGLEADAATLAFHYMRAGADDRAARYSWLAGRHARRAFAFAEAQAHFDTALSILDRRPDEPDLQSLRVDVRLDSYPVRMHLRSAADESLLRLCREAEPLAIRLGDPARLTQLYVWFAGSYFARADYANCIEVGMRGVAQAGADIRILAMTAYIPFTALLQAGRIRELIDRAPPVLTRMRDEGLATELLRQPYPPYVCLAGALGWALAMADRSEEGDRYLASALDAAQVSGHKYAIALAHAITSWAACANGDGRRAIEHGASAARIGREHRMPGPEMFGMCGSGIGQVLDGKVGEGITLLEQAVEKAAALGYAAFRTDAYYGLALGETARGDFARAATWCEKGLEAVAAGERKLEAEFHRIMAEDALRRASLDEAGGRITLARAACEVLGTNVFLERIRVTGQNLELHRNQGANRGHTLS